MEKLEHTVMSYQKEKAKERRARLEIKILQMTRGHVSQEEIDEVINGLPDKFVKFGVTSNPDIFSRKLYMGKTTKTQYISNVFWLPKRELENKEMLYDEGHFIPGDRSKHRFSEFDMNKKVAVLITNVIKGEIRPELVIYMPKSDGYKVPEEIRYFLKHIAKEPIPTITVDD